MIEPTKVLTICSRNQWRSPTAEKLINKRPGFIARSAGTASSARVQLTEKLLDWADVVLVMERSHLRRLKAEFSHHIDRKIIHCLDIPDEYRFMDPELVSLLEESLNDIFSTERDGANS